MNPPITGIPVINEIPQLEMLLNSMQLADSGANRSNSNKDEMVRLLRDLNSIQEEASRTIANALKSMDDKNRNLKSRIDRIKSRIESLQRQTA